MPSSDVVELRGVDRIPPEKQTASPRSFVGLMLGGNFNLALITFGWLPITFGLSFWSAVTAMLCGTFVGLVLIVPLVLIGSQTGTNNATASGAHFGVRGRIVGSTIGFLISLTLLALTIWTGADAVVASSARMVGTPENDTVRAISYGIATAAVAALAVYGFRVLERIEAGLSVVLGLCLVLGLGAYADGFNAGGGGPYLLGSFRDTWLLTAVIIGVSGPLSLAVMLGDWTRYISPDRFPARRLLPAALGSTFLALTSTNVLGAFIAVSLDPRSPDFVSGAVAAAPAWYLPPLLMLGLLGGVGGGAVLLYSTGLDLDAMAPRLARSRSTLVCAVVAVAYIYLGAFAFDAQTTVSAFATILIATATPWAVVTGAGWILARGRYSAEELQPFQHQARLGRYWFNAGWNPRALGAWVLGAAFGVLAADTSLYTGPLAGAASGIDVSFVGSGVIALASYLLFRTAWPEPSALPAVIS